MFLKYLYTSICTYETTIKGIFSIPTIGTSETPSKTFLKVPLLVYKYSKNPTLGIFEVVVLAIL